MSDETIHRLRMAKLTFKLFKWLYYFAAVIPLRIELDEDSGQLNRLTFSFLYPEMWWFMINSAVQIVMTIITVVQSLSYIATELTQTGHDSNM